MKMTRTGWLAAMAGLVALAPLSGTNAQDSAPLRLTFDIQSQPVGDALNSFASQSGMQVLFLSELGKDITARPVRGTLSPEQALEQLLAGSGLQYEFINPKTVTIREVRTTSGTQNGRGDQQTSAGPAREGEGDRQGGFDRIRLAQAGPEGAGVAQRQDTAPNGFDGALEEIIVTAQKRKERLIDTPQAVTVIAAEDLAKLGAVQFRDFANTVPGLNFTTAGAGFSQVSLRGVTAGRDIGPTVGIYVDEVPYGSSSAFANGSQLAIDIGLFDMERIEVLRGPQGTLYGASTMGGLLKYVTRQPDTVRMGVDVRTGISSTEDGGISYSGAATVNVPVAEDTAALRATGFYSRDGGYVDNIVLGSRDVNQSNVYGGRLDLLLTPAEGLSIRLGGFAQDIDRDGDGTTNYTAAGVPLTSDALEQGRFAAEPFDQRFRLASGTVEYEMPWATLTSISSYQTVRTAQIFDFSRFYVPFLAPTRPLSSVGSDNRNGTDKFTQEIRLASDAPQHFQWLVGAFYTHEDSTNTSEFQLRNLAGQPVPNDVFSFSTPSTYEEYAAFGDLTWLITDRLDVTGGIRYAENRQEVVQIGSGLFGSSRPATQATDNVVTYLANARFRFSNHGTTYLRYASGYRPGGPNYPVVNPATGVVTPTEPFESDELKSYEAGLKLETSDRAFGLEVAGFYIDWNNIQVTTTRNGFGIIANLPGGATIRGAELSVVARPTNAFTATLALAYQDAETSEAAPPLGAADGARLPNVPRYTGSLVADYEIPLGTLRPRVGATLRYVDERVAGFGAAPYRLPDYTAVDLRTALTFGAVDAQLFVHNLFDERGQMSAIVSATRGGVLPAILQPRTYGVSLSTKF